MQMSLNVKTPENACIFHFRGGFKLKRVIERRGGGGLGHVFYHGLQDSS